MPRPAVFPFLAMACLPFLGACASRPPAVASAVCTLAAADSVHLAAGPLYPACAVDQRARPVTASRQLDLGPFRTTAQGRDACYAAEVQVVVGVDGRVEQGTARLLRTNDPRFGEAVLASVEGWSFEPALLGGRPVRQVAHEGVRVATVPVAARVGEVMRPPEVPNC